MGGEDSVRGGIGDIRLGGGGGGVRGCRENKRIKSSLILWAINSIKATTDCVFTSVVVIIYRH